MLGLTRTDDLSAHLDVLLLGGGKEKGLLLAAGCRRETDSMPSKLRKALGAVKDQTSISLAKVSGANHSSLEVAILRATTHDEVPMEDRFATEVVLLTTSSRANAAACVRYLSRRIGRTKNWVVALKCLSLVFRILQQANPHFQHEVLAAAKRGSPLLHLSNFPDDTAIASPWDCTAFVRNFARYLVERLDCTLMGKLTPTKTSSSSSTRNAPAAQYGHYPYSSQTPTNIQRRRSLDSGHEGKPLVLLDKIVHWQRLMERALATKPTGAAKSNRLVQICLYTVVRESFDIYRDISDALSLVLDNFFHLPRHACVNAFHVCVEASKQFHDLADFYALSKSLGIGRSSEYPSVHKISDSLLDTLNEFLKDNNAHPGLQHHRNNGAMSLIQTATPPTDPAELKSPQRSEEDFEEEYYNNSSERAARGSFSSEPPQQEEERDNPLSLIEMEADESKESRTSFSSTTTATTISFLENSSISDLAALDEASSEGSKLQDQEDDEHEGDKLGEEEEVVVVEEEEEEEEKEEHLDCTGWEMALVESANNLANKLNSINHRQFDHSILHRLDEKDWEHHRSNPFLEIPWGEPGYDWLDAGGSSSSSSFLCPPPTFSAKNPDQQSILPPEEDPFSSAYRPTSPQLPVDQQGLELSVQRHVQ